MRGQIEVLGNQIGLALDCGPGWALKDAVTFARACEPMRITWIEDILTGDYTPYPNADLFRDLKQATSVPIHTGEQIYLRQNFKGLIEGQAVNIIGPDPCDVGGIAELVQGQILEGRAAELPKLRPALERFAIAVLEGAGERGDE